MKINNDNVRLTGLNAYQTANRAKSNAGKPHACEAEAPRDGVSISQAALDMARETYGDPAARAERLASVKQAIQNGTYEVEASAVVRKMLESYGEF